MIAWTVIGAGLLAILVAGQVTGASRRRLALGNDPLDRQMAILASPRWVTPLNLGGWLTLAIGAAGSPGRCSAERGQLVTQRSPYQG
jgi:hypothetical protein